MKSDSCKIEDGIIGFCEKFNLRNSFYAKNSIHIDGSMTPLIFAVDLGLKNVPNDLFA